MKVKWIEITLYKLVSFSILLVSTYCFANKPLILRTAETQPADYPTSQALEFMGEKLDEWSDGEINIKLYSGGQLGDEKDTLEITIFGGIDLARINIAPLNSIVPETNVFGLPFLFRSTAHMRNVVDGEIGEEILAALEPYGLIGLAFYDSGARSLYNNSREIRRPEDLAGLKIRVQNSDLAVAMVEALGANPTPMGFGQVYESMVLGTIDGGENNWPSYEASRHYEAAPYYTLTRHTMTPEVLVMSKHRWQKLTSKQQNLIRLAAKSSVPYMRQQWDMRVDAAQAKIISAGGHIGEPDDMQPFVDAMKPVYQKFVDTEKKRKLVERILAVEENDE